MPALPDLIYVVDDDAAVLHSTRFLLESEGLRVETFADGPELLAAFPGRARPSSSSTTSCRGSTAWKSAPGSTTSMPACPWS
ncbi:hypothetical protein [Methylobacterium sp. XJLW]|uniref:hypothetical protein n=1 Tax=Methylobacterium sp. XJLW TaxID=739141 RepID=UPI002698E3EF